MRTRLLIADSYPVFREGLKALLSGHSHLEVIAEAGNAELTVQKAREFRPDLVLIELAPPDMDGIEAIRRIKQSNPGIKVIALAAHQREHTLDAAMAAGADGCLFKEGTMDDMLCAIQRVMNGHAYLATGSGYKPAAKLPGDYVGTRSRRLLSLARTPSGRGKSH